MNFLLSKRALIVFTAVAAIIGFINSQPAAAKEQDPEKLVTKLGGSSYKEREQAMKSLSALGYQARTAVRAALNSPDPEIQGRAKELWKTIRWLVSSNVTAESIQPLLCYTNKTSEVDYRYYQHRAMIDPFSSRSAYFPIAAENIDTENWKSFIEKNKGLTLVLMADLSKDPDYQSTYRGAMRLCVDTLGPDIIIETINSSDPKTRAEYTAMFSELTIPYSANSNTYANTIAIYDKLGLHEKAFDSGKLWYQTWCQENILDQCASAVKNGKLEAKVWKEASTELSPSPGNQHTSCARLAFYAGLARRLENPRAFSALKKPANINYYDRRFAQSLFQSMLDMKLYDDTITLAANSSDPVVLYFRSLCFKAMGKGKEADTEWQKACDSVSSIPNKEASTASAYSFADFLENRNDKEAEKLWQKVLDSSASNSVYHANSCFRLARYAEQKEDLAAAVELYERGLSSSKQSSGVVSASIGIDNKVLTEDELRQRIAILKEKQAKKK